MSLLSYEDAVRAVIENSRAHGRSDVVRLNDLAGRVLAQDLFASSDYPAFDNSAVDGYAVGNLQDCAQGSKLRICGESTAGGELPGAISGGTCLRIFTGAAVPDNAVGIAMQEDVRIDGESAELLASVEEGRHIRLSGTDYRTGDRMLESGTELTPGSLALIASLGVADVRVFQKVRVAIIATGKELVESTEPVGPGQVRDSNSPMLRSLVEQEGAQAEALRIGDELEETVSAIESGAERSDLVLLSGGVSVGDYDFAPRALAELGTVLFHGVSIRPGKPVLCGKVGECVVIGLPGNPASSFVGFHLFAAPAIRALGGVAEAKNKWIDMPFASDWHARDRDDFVRCRLVETKGVSVASPAGVQASFALSSLAVAQALVRVPRGVHHVSGQMRPALIL